MIGKILALIFVVGLSMSTIHADDYRNNNDWLKDIPDSTKISDLSIPFSHDSFMWDSNMKNRGSMTNVYKFTATTQSDTIQKQFYVGNRGFDLRTYVENENRSDKTHQIGIAHGDGDFWAESNIQLEEAFKQFDQLLNEHPREFLFFRIAIERDIGKDNCDAYVTQANNLINQYPNRFITYRDGLTVGECRGKFLVGYKTGKGSFGKKGTVDPFSRLGNMNQWFKIIFSNDFTVEEDSEELMNRFDFINSYNYFTKGYNKPAFIECNRPWSSLNGIWHGPHYYAEKVNPRTEEKLLHINYAGMVSHDYSNEWWYIPNRIINLNFK